MKSNRTKAVVAAAMVIVLAATAAPALMWAESPEARQLMLLYFPASNGFGLDMKEAPVDISPDPSVTAARILQALDSADNGRFFPPGIKLRQAFIDRAGTAYVDLSASDDVSGCSLETERLIVWSVVNTLCLNMTAVEEVKILVNGTEADSLFGHIDLSLPLIPDESLTASPDQNAGSNR